MAVTTGEGDAQSEVSGVNSSRSSGSRKYRVVSRESKVDESLFASKTTTANRNNDYQREPARRAFAGDVSATYFEDTGCFRCLSRPLHDCWRVLYVFSAPMIRVRRTGSTTPVNLRRLRLGGNMPVSSCSVSYPQQRNMEVGIRSVTNQGLHHTRSQMLYLRF